ncbi:MAG TPA: hypothetical protein VJP06_01800 [Thermoplasmata archaeon]|nr:hypothetical protein [Thermoplasmata archaeon]
MVVEARLGLFRSFVFTDGVPEGIRRGRSGWLYVVGLPGGSGRVRYDGWRDRVEIESAAGGLEIRFRWRNTTFFWQGRTYRFVPSVWGRLAILDETVPVVEGHTTWSGVWLEQVGPAFRAIQRELAVGLAKRAQAFASVGIGVF